MAKNRPSSFGAVDNLDFGVSTYTKKEINEIAQHVQQVQQVQEVHEVQVVQEEFEKEYGSTQGRKGIKLKRINMAFSDINHNFITRESRKQGISATALVNLIIDEYRKK